MTAPQDELDYLWNRRFGVLYRVQLSVLYHQKRERFFEMCDKLGKSVAVIGGSAALARLGGESVLQIVAAAITVSSTLSLVFGFSDRSRRHSELARNFRQLEVEILSKGERTFEECDVIAWEVKERGLEVSEPPALGTLVILCQNELALATGQSDKIRHIGWWRRITAHLFDSSEAVPS